MSSSSKSKTAGVITRTKRTASGNSGKNETRMLQPEMREQMIAESAYYRAMGRGFIPGYEALDWLAAEDEIDRLLLNKV